jgi:hypothetical protein
MQSKNYRSCSPPGAHACKFSYLGRWDWEDCGSNPTQANNLENPISKITRKKWTGVMAFGSYMRVLVLLGQSPVFKHHSLQRKKNTRDHDKMKYIYRIGNGKW